MERLVLLSRCLKRVHNIPGQKSSKLLNVRIALANSIALTFVKDIETVSLYSIN
jgi:hypothetical protein